MLLVLDAERQAGNQDGGAKSRCCSIAVIPAKAGIILFQWVMNSLRGKNMFGDFLRAYPL
jgi:hypothetical protein